MLLLEQNITRKGRVDENVTEFKASNDKQYKVEGIWDSAVYAKESAASHLLELYYLISLKSYFEEKNI